MAIQPFSIPIVRSTDRSYHEAVGRLAEAIEVNVPTAKFVAGLRRPGNQEIGFDVANPLTDGASKHDLFQRFLGFEDKLLRAMVYTFVDGMTLTLKRSFNGDSVEFDKQHDTLSVNFGYDDELKSLAVLKAIRAQFRCWDEVYLPNAISADLKAYYGARENNARQLEDKLGELTSKLADFAVQNEREVMLKKAQLEEAQRARMAELEEQRKQLLAEAADRQKELDERAAKINDRENVHERRRLYDEMKKQIQSKSIKPELTTHTQGLRKLVWQLSGGLGVFLLSVFIICFVINLRSESVNWVAVGSQIASGASLLGLGAFTIRWQNRWFENHSDEEFRLKRMELDMERASWLVELALEWTAETNNPIPPELLDKLATSLFTDGTTVPFDTSPLESLRTGMLGKNWRLSVEPGKVEVQSGKNGK